jgi:hypothetical protein
LRFAKSEPGLFHTAIAASDKLLQSTPTWSSKGSGGLNPLELLGAALDKLVDAGLMQTVRHLGAKFMAWSAVHGLAMLVIDGTLAVIKPQMEQVGQRSLDMVERSLT